NDRLFDAWERIELRVHGFGRELERPNLAVRIEVHRVAVGLTTARQRVHEAARPATVIAIRPAADQVRSRSEVARIRRVVAKLLRGALGLIVSAASPQLIADAPVANLERLARSVGGAFV